MGETIRMWRYSLPPEGISNWAIVLMDSTGMFGVVSDYGNYAFKWSHHGESDFRRFVCRLPADYVRTKLDPSTVFDEESTRRALKNALIELRRERYIEKDDARDEWDEIEGLEGEADFGAFVRRSKIDAAWECGRSIPAPQVSGFVTHILPRLQAVLRAELEAEASRAA